MNTKLSTFNQTELSNFKNTELVTVFNKFAAELTDVSPVKKFADKKSAIRRVSKIQEDYVVAKNSVVAKQFKDAQTSVKKTPAKKKAVVKDNTKIHGLNKTSEWRVCLGIRIRKGTILDIIAHAFDAKCYLIEDLIEYLVDNAPKNPNRKPMTSAYAAEYIKWYSNKGSIEVYTSYNEE